jgi:hypothetical protein
MSRDQATSPISKLMPLLPRFRMQCLLNFESWLRAELSSDQLETIGNEAFWDNTKLRTVTLQSPLKIIGKWALGNCSKLHSPELPEGLESIGEGALCGCNFRNVRIPPSITELRNGSFEYCLKLLSLELPEQIKAIHDYAFHGLLDVEINRVLLEHCPDDLIVKDKWGYLPFYYACGCDAPLEIIQLFVENHTAIFPDEELDWTKMVKRSRLDLAQLLLASNLVFANLPSRITHKKEVIQQGQSP